MPSGTYVQFEAKEESERRPPIDELRRGRHRRPFAFRRQKSSATTDDAAGKEKLPQSASSFSDSFSDFLQSPSRFAMLQTSRGTGKLGMVDGVFFRCLTNIFGVIMFLRLPWMIGYAGILYSVIVILVASALTLATALSMSAICTNGQIAGGGAYYMISRSLGPEFGGSIGVLFYAANATSVSLYLLGFAETLKGQVVTRMDERLIAWLSLIGLLGICLIGVTWVIKVEKLMLGFLVVAIIMIVLGGFLPDDAQFETKAFVTFDAGRNFFPDWKGLEAPVNDLGNVTCVNSASESLQQLYGTVDFAVILAVFFPAVCGIMAGANVSGDLKDPAYAIPKGTLLAIVVSVFVYVFLVVYVAGVSLRVVVESSHPSAHGDICTYGGLYHDTLLLPRISLLPSVVYIGIYCATLSSGLASLLGAPRILQALARDRLFPFLNPLAAGVGASQEPRRAYFVTFIIASICIMTGDINSVAPLITTFFLASYAMVNYACFALETSSSPGWRPSFRYFNQYVALAGALGCVTLMLLLSAVTGFITFIIGLALYKYIEVTGEGNSSSLSHWGPVRDAARYNTALNAALELESSSFPKSQSTSFDPIGSPLQSPLRENQDEESEMTNIELGQVSDTQVGFPDDENAEREHTRHVRHALDAMHVKHYRPQCLVLCGPPDRRPALAFLASGLRKARGVVIFGDVIVGDISDPEVLELRNNRQMVSYVAEYGIEGFSDIGRSSRIFLFEEVINTVLTLALQVIAKSFRDGARSLLQLGGLGRTMRVNTLLMGYLENWRLTPSDAKEEPVDKYSPRVSVEDFVGVIGEAFDLGFGVAILRGETMLLGKDFLPQAAEIMKSQISMASPEDSGELAEDSNANANGSSMPRRQSDHWEKLDEVDDVAIKPMNSVHMPERTIEFKGNHKRIDVYWIADDGGLMLMLPHLLRQAKTPPWADCQLRVMTIGFNKADAEQQEVAMRSLLKRLRIKAEVQVVSMEYFSYDDAETAEGSGKAGADEDGAAKGEDIDLDLTKFRKIGEIITVCSSDALLIVASLPVPPIHINPETYMNWLEALSGSSIAPLLLVRGSNRDVLTVAS